MLKKAKTPAVLCPAGALWLGLVLIILRLSQTRDIIAEDVAPRNYKYGEVLELKVKRLTSGRAFKFPISYYSLPFCKPEKSVEGSLYEIKMMVPQSCRVLCEKKYNHIDRALFRDRIANGYSVNWIVDNLPAAVRLPMLNGKEYYAAGLRLGFETSDPANEWRRLYFLVNHVRIRLHVHQNPAQFEGYRVIRFEVIQFTVNHIKDSNGNLKTCSKTDPVSHVTIPQYIGASDSRGDPSRILDVIWTYDVEFVESEVPWESRRDAFNLPPAEKFASVLRPGVTQKAGMRTL